MQQGREHSKVTTVSCDAVKLFGPRLGRDADIRTTGSREAESFLTFGGN